MKTNKFTDEQIASGKVLFNFEERPMTGRDRPRSKTRREAHRGAEVRDGGVLVHCHAGKDRTGVLAAVQIDPSVLGDDPGVAGRVVPVVRPARPPEPPQCHIAVARPRRLSTRRFPWPRLVPFPGRRGRADRASRRAFP